MQKRLVLTLTGNDRIGIVDDVTKIVLTYHGNVESSRMARLGGEFVMLMLLSVAEAQQSDLEAAISALRDQGFELSIRPTEHGVSRKFKGWHNYQINVRGADHEGIIYEITHLFAQHGISVETADTGTEDAPFGGTKLFTMSATVFAPPNLTLNDLQEEMEAVGRELHVDIEVTPHAG